MYEFLKEYISKIGIELDDERITKLLKYYELLIEKNKVMNLTAITDFNEVVIKHFADSLSIVSAIKIIDGSQLIDIGTGAGFPGIVLKIVFPELKITLLDSLNKRVGFLNEVIKELELKDIVALHGRAEDFGSNPKYREKYDICVSRAVANLSSLSEYCIPFVKKDGIFVSYKAGNSEDEINDAKKAIKCLGGKIEECKELTLPDTDISRCFVIIKKIENTNKKYPRKAGTPTKDPII